MITHDYQCLKCGKVTESLEQAGLQSIECVCGGSAVKIFTPPRAYHVWKPCWFEHIDSYPIWIESKKQLRKECGKRGLTAVCLS